MENQEIAIFSGGCFWCVSEVFESLPGVSSVVSGYTGGRTLNPTYEEVCSETTGHKEAVQIIYDPSKSDYEALLDVFWHNIDPFDAEGQFCDKGDSYKAVIFYADDRQKQKAETSKQKLEQFFKKSIVTEILKATTFYPAEDYHQGYCHTNPLRYSLYRLGCGRDHRLKEIWK